MAPSADGRMLRRDIANSSGFASLSPMAAVLFCMLIPHFNAHGKLNGGAGFIKDEICPKVPYLTYANIPGLLQEISDRTSVKYFEHDSRWWLHSIHFLTRHQKLRPEKLGEDKLPSWSVELRENSGSCSGELRDYSGTTPKNLLPEEEVEEEVEEEGEGNFGRQVSPPSRSLFDLWNEVAQGSGLPRAREFTNGREKKCRSRMKERSLDEWREIFELCASTPFLCGENERGWRIGFDWIVENQENAAKVLEGKYQQSGGSGNSKRNGDSPDRYAMFTGAM